MFKKKNLVHNEGRGEGGSTDLHRTLTASKC